MPSRCAVSIIIPVFNEAKSIAELLEKIRALELNHTEIIVIDDGSTDGIRCTALQAVVCSL